MGVLVADGSSDAIVGGLRAKVTRGVGNARVQWGEWSCILNPDSAIRLSPKKSAMRSECIVVRLLVALTAAKMRESVGIWANSGRIWSPPTR